MRHGQTEDTSTGGDYLRALTPRGRAEAEAMGQTWKSLVDIRRCVVSGAERTRQTAEAVQAGAQSSFEIVERRDLYLGGSETLCDVLAQEVAATGVTLLVAHNPGIGGALRRLTGERIAFAPGTAVLIALHLENWSELGPGCGSVRTCWSPGGRLGG